MGLGFRGLGFRGLDCRLCFSLCFLSRFFGVSGFVARFWMLCVLEGSEVVLGYLSLEPR